MLPPGADDGIRPVTYGVDGMRRLRASILVAGFVVLAIAPVATFAADNGIDVAGNQRIEADTIRSYFRAGAGGLDEAVLDAGLKKLYATEQFADVRVARRDGRGVVTVVENPSIGRIAFEGNSRIKDDDLRKAVGSKERAPLSRAKVQQDVTNILELYHHRARFDVQVEPKTIEASDHRVSLVFEIKEGARTGVRQVLFTGNNAYAATQLRGTIKTGQTNLLSSLLDNDLYDPDRIEGDRELLRRFYLARGYADVRISAPVAQYDPEKKGFVLTFTIEEGARYRVGNAAITSTMASIDADSLRGGLATHAGDVYNADAIDKTVSGLLGKLASRGQPFATVRAKAERVPGGNMINLSYVVEDAEHMYVERIQIHGNTKTRDNVIRREFDFAEGDAYNSALVARAEKRLKNLGYFKTVAITHQAGSTSDRVIVDVALQEGDTGNFSISGGYSTTDGPIVEVGVSDRNLMGRGEVVKASVTYGQYTRGFDVGFVEPYVFGTRASVGADVFGKQTTSSTYQSYDSTTYGGKISVGVPLNEELGTQWNYSLYRQSLTLDPAMGTASLPIREAAAAGPTWVSSIGTGVTYSTLDNNKNPTSGWRASINEEVAGFGGDAKFAKTTDDIRYYQPIADGVVGMVRTQSGYVTPWGGQPLSSSSPVPFRARLPPTTPSAPAMSPRAPRGPAATRATTPGAKRPFPPGAGLKAAFFAEPAPGPERHDPQGLASLSQTPRTPLVRRGRSGPSSGPSASTTPIRRLRPPPTSLSVCASAQAGSEGRRSRASTRFSAPRPARAIPPAAAIRPRPAARSACALPSAADAVSNAARSRGVEVRVGDGLRQLRDLGFERRDARRQGFERVLVLEGETGLRRRRCRRFGFFARRLGF